MWLSAMRTLVWGENTGSAAEARVPQPVRTAPGASPAYCLTTIPPNEVFRIVDPVTVMPSSRVAVAGGAAGLGTVVSNTMPPVSFDRSQPVLKVTPGALPAVSPLIQFTKPVPSCTYTDW